MQHGPTASYVQCTASNLSVPQAGPAAVHLPRYICGHIVHFMQQSDGFRARCATTDLSALRTNLAVCQGVPDALHINGPALLQLLFQLQNAVDCSAQTS